MWQPNVSIFVDVAPSSLVPTWIGTRNDPNTPIIFFLPLNLSSHCPCHGGMPLSREGADREEEAAAGHGAATARSQEMRWPQGSDDPATGSDAGHGEGAPAMGRRRRRPSHGEATPTGSRGGRSGSVQGGTGHVRLGEGASAFGQVAELVVDVKETRLRRILLAMWDVYRVRRRPDLARCRRALPAARRQRSRDHGKRAHRTWGGAPGTRDGTVAGHASTGRH
jgi:hypothetical protein